MTNNIKQQLFSGVFYTAIAKYSGIIISLVVAGILARLLSPDDFGIVAIATVIISFFAIFTDMGLSPAIIQNKALTQDDLTNIYSFTFWTGIAVALLFFIASWPISAYYDSPILRTLCQLLSINLFFASVNIVPGALFYKNKEFKFIAIRSFVIQITAGTGAVIAALSGAGLYALLITPIVSSILIYIISFHRYPPTSTHDVRAIIHSEDLLLFRLPVSIQCHLLFQQEFRQTADRQTYGNVRPRILREILPPHDASLAEYHTSGHSGDAPYLQ